MPVLDEIRRRAWSPPRKETSWEWAERNVTSIPYSPIPGGFDSSFSPFIREIMEEIENVRSPLVVLRLCVQSCKSLGIELSIAAWTVRDPAPTQLVLPQAAEASDEMQMRLRPLLEAIPPVAELIPTLPPTTGGE